jgi:formylglycine-generating enzyme required for sulfatase activity
MKSKILWMLLCSVCAAIPLAAQTTEPEGAQRKGDSAQSQEMVQIPAGKFWMGRSYTIYVDSADLLATDRKDDRPANNIYLDAFYIDTYEVTNADYTKYVDAKGVRPPWHWPEGKFPSGKERLPVYNVNWFEAADYCKWVGKRLPTEAEWEKAARGGLDRNRYAWGDADVDTSEIRLGAPQTAGRTTNAPVPAVLKGTDAAPVGSVKPNGYGLYDMIGNVREWTNDWYQMDYYLFMPKANPQGPATGRYKSIRGSGWLDDAPGSVGGPSDTNTVDARDFGDPDMRMTTIGFRCAK